MKYLKIQFKVLSTLLFFSFTIISCQKADNEPIDDTSGSKVRIITNFEEYERLLNARTAYKGSPFEITDVKRDGKNLKISVEGGCDTEVYRVYWDGNINFTEPATANLMVAYEPKTEMQCLATAKTTIDVDLQILLGKAYQPNMHVMVSNASKPNDKVIDDKGVVTESGDCVEKVDTDKVCTAQYDPVCGCNLKTYSNACTAGIYGIRVLYMGECKK